MIYHLHTKRGYSFPGVSSAMQKAIRRGDAKLAGYWALEFWASGFGSYVWRRLLTVSAEDCWGILTAEFKALHDSYIEINRNTPAKSPKGRIFVSKAVILLCLAKKSRDPDQPLQLLITGAPGIGKTSLVNMIARTLASQPVAIEDVNSKEVGLELAREWTRTLAYGSIFGSWSVRVVNELDRCSKDAQDR